MLTFEEAPHIYRWNGVVVPNVTKIIGHLTSYDHIPPDRLANLQQEGRDVHRMVELSCAGTLDVESLADWLRPHYQAWLRFLEETGFEALVSEYRVYHTTQCYAGTLDLLGEFKKLKGATGIALIDVKRSLYAGPAIGLQLAGYDNALRADKTMPRPNRRYALRLGKDRRYHLDAGVKVNGTAIPFDAPENGTAFLACLQQFRWRQKHYPEKENGNGST